MDMWLPGTADGDADAGLRVSLPPMSASSTIGARRVELPERIADERTLANDRLRLRFDERGRLPACTTCVRTGRCCAALATS